MTNKLEELKAAYAVAYAAYEVAVDDAADAAGEVAVDDGFDDAAYYAAFDAYDAVEEKQND